MGGKSGSPDPVKTSTAQGEMNRTNQVGPFGSLTYTQTGTNPDGTPIYTANQTISPQLQGLYNQIGKPNPALDPRNLQTQFDTQQKAAYDKQLSYLQPQMDVQNRDLTSKLAEQGITQGSDAYNTAQQLQSNQQNFAKQQAFDSSYASGLAGENQQFSQGIQESNLPVSQLATLFSLNNPNGQINSNTLAQLAAQNYQNQVASQNNTNSGLYSLIGTALIGAAASDIRVKKDIVSLGVRPDGIGVYSFRYWWEEGGIPHVGVMAQEVERIKPHAVIEINGIKHVNYGAL